MTRKQFPNNNGDENWDKRGSIWRKWDLHVHTPGTQLSDGYKIGGGKDIWEVFCDEIEKSDVQVFGITDYFSAKNYFTFVEKFSKRYPKSAKRFFLNIELRLNESVNKKLEEVNLHLLFNPESLGNVEKFLSKLHVVKTGQEGSSIACSELKTSTDFESASVTRPAIDKAFEETFGKKAKRADHLLVITAANNDGIRAERGQKRKEVISDEIDKFSDAFFGGEQNIPYFQRQDRLEDKEALIRPKPILTGCDAHSFEQLSDCLGQRKMVTKDGAEVCVCDATWIKADKTYEGLKQIIYEPEPGERVNIGPLEPDSKEGFKVIKKIRFEKDASFPHEVVFNRNLCSIIGSRSSGKSALLAYIAHAVDPASAESIVDGPGEGHPYDDWGNLSLQHAIEWGDADTAGPSQGRVVYIPQNYLFDQSRNPEVIKERIEPVLFAALPDFGALYSTTVEQIKVLNRQISDEVRGWFGRAEEATKIDLELRKLGDKTAVEAAKKEIEAKVEKLKKDTSLSEEELATYKTISGQASALLERIKAIDQELALIGDTASRGGYFSTVSVSLTPDSSALSSELRKKIDVITSKSEKNALETLNRAVDDHIAAIKKERTEAQTKIDTIKRVNKDLIEKYKNNADLNELLKQLGKQTATIQAIDTFVKRRNATKELLETHAAQISEALAMRASRISELADTLNSGGANVIGGIKFTVEIGFGNLKVTATRGFNLLHNSGYITKKEDEPPILNVEVVRKNPKQFMEDLYSGEQKIKIDSRPEDVAHDALELTEKILFSGEMEGDKIGGFESSTMTPGKRALFTLRLILAESAETWPLLIDQPEDDLDSRSVYDDIVPLLKREKKKRQIIMVSHNANLVIASDSEQVIVANRNGGDRPNEDGKHFNYLSGALEYTKQRDASSKDTLLAQGVREHACEILDGGQTAFEQRRNKYNLREAA